MKMIAASIIIKDKIRLHNVPDILDIEKLCAILTKMNAKISRTNHSLEIDTSELKNIDPDPHLVRSIRASIVLVGPLLARFGHVKIPLPGGDKIGSRPIDRHIKAFKDLGISVQAENNFYIFKKGKVIKETANFEKITVTGTENILLFAAAQNQNIVIKNAAIEPEIIDLINFLKKAGAKINIEGRELKIKGSVNLKGVEHTVIPDRIEAGTFAILGTATGSDLEINNVRAEHIGALLEKFREIGVEFEINNDKLYIRKSDNLNAVDISTAEYPGFPTDLQSPIGVLLTQARGMSHIKENIFENRLGYLEELKKMGAKINILNDQEAEIYGPTELSGAKIESLDLRAGATLIIAGLLAHGKTEILGAETIDRGYEKIEERFAKIGAKIQRIN